MKRLLFLCSRGVVSGPMAKALFQHMGPSLLLNWEVGGWWVIVTIKMRIMIMTIVMTMIMTTMLPIVCQVFCLATSTGLTIDSRDSPKVVALMQASST